MNKRHLTKNEELIISKLLSIKFNGREELLSQIEGCAASSTSDPDNYGSVYLYPLVKPAQVALSVPVEGVTKDSDDVPVNILLHINDGLLAELEIVKLDGTKLQSSIDPDKIEVFVNQ